MKILGKKKSVVKRQSRIKQHENINSKSKEKIAISNINDSIQKLLEIEQLGFFRITRNDITLSDIAKYIIGFDKNEIVTIDKLIEKIHADDKERISKLLKYPSLSQSKTIVEYRIIKEKNEFKELINIRSCVEIIKVGDNNPALPAGGNELELICTIKDISREEKIKKELIKLKEKAEESDKLKTIFLSNISHEIRTPMNSILGFTELLKLTGLYSDKKDEYIKIIKQQGQLLLQLIDNIVDLTKIESGNIHINKTPCNLNLLLNEIFLRFNRQKIQDNKDNIEIIIKFPEKDGVIIYTDTGRLQQIIYSLINNSLKSLEKGKIEFGYYKKDNDKIEFYVKDTGSGYTKEEQKYIFSMYLYADITEKIKYEGSGLDLTIAKALVKLLGGKIWIESELNTGSTFYFSLPYVEIPENNSNLIVEEPHAELDYKWKDKVILIVEDEEVNVMFLEALFQDTGAKTISAKNGAQAVELCKSINKIDIILMDIKMPVLNGISATRKIREFNQNVPIIAQTALSDEEDLNKMRIAGCNDAVLKPIEIEELFKIVNRYLGD